MRCQLSLNWRPRSARVKPGPPALALSARPPAMWGLRRRTAQWLQAYLFVGVLLSIVMVLMLPAPAGAARDDDGVDDRDRYDGQWSSGFPADSMDESGRCKCPRCPAVFRSRRAWRRHVQRRCRDGRKRRRRGRDGASETASSSDTDDDDDDDAPPPVRARPPRTRGAAIHGARPIVAAGRPLRAACRLRCSIRCHLRGAGGDPQRRCGDVIRAAARRDSHPIWYHCSAAAMMGCPP